MEQLIEYSNIKTLGDITKTFACIPMKATLVDGKPQFTIAGFEDFKSLITRLCEEYNQGITITENNVSTYEKEAAQINKLKKQVKDDAQSFVEQFTLSLLGNSKRGKNKVKGQVDVIQEILQETYNHIHEATSTFRNIKKQEKESLNVIEGDFIEQLVPSEENTSTIVLKVPNSELEGLKTYCLQHNIDYQLEVTQYKGE